MILHYSEVFPYPLIILDIAEVFLYSYDHLIIVLLLFVCDDISWDVKHSSWCSIILHRGANICSRNASFLSLFFVVAGESESLVNIGQQKIICFVFVYNKSYRVQKTAGKTRLSLISI